MGIIRSVSTAEPSFHVDQQDAMHIVRSLFSDSFRDIDRLLPVFQNGGIENRQLCMPLEWYSTAHDFKTANDLYIEHAAALSKQAIENCLAGGGTLERAVSTEEIDALIFVSSSGIAAPSIDARLMNMLPFRQDLVRIPIWGLGCAGGAAGLSRAFDYCKAHPAANVLVAAVELCSLTFQRGDTSKSNLIGTSLFADGAACALVTGSRSEISCTQPMPEIKAAASRFMPRSENIMGWDVENDGLHVVFSRSIPAVVTEWLAPFVHQFIGEQRVQMDEITNFIAHPGGKKVLEAYEQALGLTTEQTAAAREVLRKHGNMSSPTILYVLKSFIEQSRTAGEYGLLAALGPGFSGELLLAEWQND